MLLPAAQEFLITQMHLIAAHFCLLSGENEMVIMRPGNRYEYKFGFELPEG